MLCRPNETRFLVKKGALSMFVTPQGFGAVLCAHKYVICASSIARLAAGPVCLSDTVQYLQGITAQVAAGEPAGLAFVQDKLLPAYCAAAGRVAAASTPVVHETQVGPSWDPYGAGAAWWGVLQHAMQALLSWPENSSTFWLWPRLY